MSIGFLSVFLAILANAGASILLKHANLYAQVRSMSLSNIIYLGWLTAALFSYALAFLSYMQALRVFPVSTTYPIITSGSVLLIFLYSIYIFNETVDIIVITGIFLILSGVTLLASKMI